MINIVNHDERIISQNFQEVIEFLKKLKQGEVYNILPVVKLANINGDPWSNRFPSLLEIDKFNFTKYLDKKSNIALCLDRRPWMLDSWNNKPINHIERDWQYCFVKVLVNDKIGLIHAAFLEKL